jgi:hypothetical protein
MQESNPISLGINGIKRIQLFPINTTKRRRKRKHFLILIIIFFSIILFSTYLNSKKAHDSAFENRVQNLEKIRENQLLLLKGLKKPLKLTIDGVSPEGYGNKLYSWISSLVLAIITESAMVSRWEFIGNFIEAPFYQAFFEGFSINDIESIDPEFSTSIQNIYTPKASLAWKKVKDMNFLVRTSIPENITLIAFAMN